MVWQDSHLYLFILHGKEHVDHRVFDFPEAEDELLMTLAEAILAIGESMHCTYDMGDNWKHTLTVLDMKPVADDQHPCVLLGGSWICPPEDAGGVSCLEEFCAAIQKPRSKRYREYRD